MTVEDLHDALTLLPGELVAEADKRRNRRPSVIVWRRWAAMAACLVLILSCGLFIRKLQMGAQKLTQETMKNQAAYDKAAPENAQQGPMAQGAPRTGGGMNEDRKAASNGSTMDQGSFPPEILNISWVETPADSTSAVNTSEMPGVNLISNRKALAEYLTGRVNENVDALRESTAGYDDGWFAVHDLLLIRLHCPAGTSVESIQKSDGKWEIYLGESPLSLRSVYHILIDTEKGTIESADHVTISYAEP